MPNQHLSLEERFWIKVSKTKKCWQWTGAISRVGYARFNLNGHNRLAHRVSYEMLVRKIPKGKFLDHLCRNRSCVNPAHLEVVTFKENVLRGIGPAAINKRKTHCMRGHKFDAKNTYAPPAGGRTCKICRRVSDAKRRPRR